MTEETLVLTLDEILIRLGIVVLLVLANGFFVAAEFALVGARPSRIEAEAKKGNTRARLAHNAIRHLDHYISGTQLGITLASLGLGWVGENTLAAIFMQSFGGLAEPWDVVASHAVAGTIAFALITFLHIVLGELAPKSLALLYPERVSIWTAAPLIIFSKILTPFIYFLNGSANLLLRAFHLQSPSEVERVHRPEEIELIVKHSHEFGELAEEPMEMIRGVFDLSETTAGEVMTPRTDVVAIQQGSTVDGAADLILAEGHSRVPVYTESLDRIIGIVIARDVWRAQRAGKTELGPLIRPVPFVPDSKPIEPLLREMQVERIHMAVVVDEFGGTAGIVTIEDLIEEIVGEIQDEHEEEPLAIEELEKGAILLTGGVPLADLNDRFTLELPEDEYTTVAGYVMGQLGRIAHEGDEVAFARGGFRVTEMDGRRIERIVMTVHTDATEPESEAGEAEA